MLAGDQQARFASRSTTLCRVLFGELDAVSYDWLGEPATRRSGPQPAAVTHHGRHTAGDVLALYPDRDNVHLLRAHTAVAMLDVLIPGYVDGALVLCDAGSICVCGQRAKPALYILSLSL